MEKKKFKLGLVPKLIIAIIIGILIGHFTPAAFSRVIVTASSLFSTFLRRCSAENCRYCQGT